MITSNRGPVVRIWSDAAVGIDGAARRKPESLHPAVDGRRDAFHPETACAVGERTGAPWQKALPEGRLAGCRCAWT